jgi:toluene monooxygenase electron transfer component
MQISVETRLDELHFECAPDETLLVAALASGANLPYECATGTCGSCHARVMKGTVNPGWLEAPGYARLRPAIGDILMCQTFPRTDCTLLVRSNISQPRHREAVTMKRAGRVAYARRLTSDVLHFEVDLSSPIDFDAGQFVTLGSPEIVGRRAYSMTNYGRNLTRLSFVVKRKPGGAFCDWLFDEQIVGKRLEVTGPLGRATFRPEEQRNIVCIAGGSGIAGMMAILEHATSIGYFRNHTGHVFFGVRSLADAFFVDEFAKHVESAEVQLEITVAISHELAKGPQHPQFPGIEVREGFVHEVASARMAGRWDNAIGYVAGPQPMVDAALKVLIAEGGLSSEFIRYDKFS